MPLDFKTETSQEEPVGQIGKLKGALLPLVCWLSLGLSLVGFWLILRAIKAIHPSKPVEIACEEGIGRKLEESAVTLERVRAQIIQ